MGILASFGLTKKPDVVLGKHAVEAIQLLERSLKQAKCFGKSKDEQKVAEMELFFSKQTDEKKGFSQVYVIIGFFTRADFQIAQDTGTAKPDDERKKVATVGFLTLPNRHRVRVTVALREASSQAPWPAWEASLKENGKLVRIAGLYLGN